jgi:hypothetical protein
LSHAAWECQLILNVIPAVPFQQPHSNHIQLGTLHLCSSICYVFSCLTVTSPCCCVLASFSARLLSLMLLCLLLTVCLLLAWCYYLRPLSLPPWSRAAARCPPSAILGVLRLKPHWGEAWPQNSLPPHFELLWDR